MKKLLSIVLASSFVIGIGTVYGFDVTRKQTSEPTIGATVIKMDKNRLYAHSTEIVKGKVIGSETKTAFTGEVTDFEIEIDEVIQGDEARKVVKVRTEGNGNNPVKSGLVSFTVGESVTLFLTDDKGNRPDRGDFDYFVVGQAQGKFKEYNGKLKNNKGAEFSKDTFKDELKQIEKENKEKGIKKERGNYNDL